jgi:pimeloyl-ACP methyl ester carboxylesterase
MPVVSVGIGPPLILFPGLSRRRVEPGPQGELGATRAYGPLASKSARRVIVVGRPHGMSRGTTMPELASAHEAALSELFGREVVDVIGISTGGAVALQLAVDHPLRIRRLIVATSASWLGDDGRAKLRRYAELVATGRSGASVLASVLVPRSVQWPVALLLWIADRLGERKVDAGDMLATIDAECAYDVTSRLGAICARTLVVGGMNDRAFPPQLTRATAAGIPNAELRLYARRGHITAMLDPRFGADVAAFLARD